MTRSKLFIGISAVALSTALGAGSAAAQSNTSSVSGCGAGTGNTCTVNNNAAGNDRNQSTISIGGTGNAVTVDQIGDDNRSFVTISGNSNSVDHDQVADENFANTNITGDANRSDIEQRDENNSATVSINGTRNTGTVLQGSFFSGGEPSTPTAGGQNNTATILLQGNNLSASIQQGGGAGGPSEGDNVATLDLSSQSNGSAVAGDFSQSAVVFQQSRGNTARATIRGGLASAGVNTGANSVNIQQSNTQFQTASDGTVSSGAPTTAANTPAIGNTADVSVSGFGNSVFFQQNGVQNNRGGVTPAGPRGTSNATEPTGADTIDVATGGTTTSSGATFDGLATAPGRRAGNDVFLQQSGRDNRIRVSVGAITNASDERAAASGRGNQLSVTQGTAVAGAGNEGRGHFAQVFQQGLLSRTEVTQLTNTAASAVSTSNTTGAQSGSVARIGQSDTASFLSLVQNGTNRADLSQGGRGSGNSATGRTGNNDMRVSQTDTGDQAGQASNDPFGGGGAQPGTQQFNEALTSQSGRFNSMTVTQNGRGAYAFAFQRNGANSSTLEIIQGGGNGGGGFGAAQVAGSGVGASSNTSATVNQGGSGTTRVRQDGTNLTVTVNQNNLNTATVTSTAANRASVGVSQVGNNNSASVTQAGAATVDFTTGAVSAVTSGSLFHSATVDQRSNNTSSGNPTNVVTIAQVGAANSTNRNVATARQTNANAVSPTAAAGNTGTTSVPADEPGLSNRSGANASVIRIVQRLDATGVTATDPAGNNTATVEQQGAGQVGIIEQSGRRNEAGILQGVNATNSVAVIRQTGNGNTFFINQQQANQFFRVVQSGGNNTITGSGAPNAPGDTPGGEGGTVSPVFTGTP